MLWAYISRGTSKVTMAIAHAPWYNVKNIHYYTTQLLDCPGTYVQDVSGTFSNFSIVDDKRCFIHVYRSFLVNYKRYQCLIMVRKKSMTMAILIFLQYLLQVYC